MSDDRGERWADLTAAAAAISEQIALIHTESYDTPVKHAVAHVLDDLVVAVLECGRPRVSGFAAG